MANVRLLYKKVIRKHSPRRLGICPRHHQVTPSLEGKLKIWSGAGQSLSKLLWPAPILTGDGILNWLLLSGVLSPAAATQNNTDTLGIRKDLTELITVSKQVGQSGTFSSQASTLHHCYLAGAVEGQAVSQLPSHQKGTEPLMDTTNKGELKEDPPVSRLPVPQSMLGREHNTFLWKAILVHFLAH